MEHQKIANLLDNSSNQLSRNRIKNWVEIDSDTRGAYSINKQN